MIKRQFSDHQLMTILLKYADEHFSMTIENMALMKFDLIFLESQLITKGQESRLKGKPPSEQYLESIKTIKRAILFISMYVNKLGEMESALQEQARQLDYYRSQQPRVDFSKIKMHWNGQRVKYIKDFVL